MFYNVLQCFAESVQQNKCINHMQKLQLQEEPANYASALAAMTKPKGWHTCSSGCQPTMKVSRASKLVRSIPSVREELAQIGSASSIQCWMWQAGISRYVFCVYRLVATFRIGAAFPWSLFEAFSSLSPGHLATKKWRLSFFWQLFLKKEFKCY